MKTRDELVEMFALAYVTPDMLGHAEPAIVMDVAFAEAERFADAFIAERERRAAKDVPAPEVVRCDAFADGDPCEGTGIATHYDVSDSGNTRLACCGGVCCSAGNPGWTRAPLASEDANSVPPVPVSARERLAAMERAAAEDLERHDPAPEPLRFNEAGNLLGTDGNTAYIRKDGYGGLAITDEAAVYFKSKDRAHAEQIVAAALAAGRAVKP